MGTILETGPKRRVAIVHEWLVNYAGSEAVLAELCKLFPEADLFALIDFLKDEDRAKIQGKHARTSFIQKLPRAKKNYQTYLPLMPLAVEQFDLSSYDLVISSHHAVAKGVLTGPGQTHICYCHTPIRYAWDLQHQYLREAGLNRGFKAAMARLILHYMRIWDYRTAAGVDKFIANSRHVAARIMKVYRREADIIHPPVDIETFSLREDKEDFYFTASRLVPYKRVDLIVEAFAKMPQKRLIVIGDGPEMPKLRRLAAPNVILMGYQSHAVLKDHLQRARAFVFAAEEDFGILPVEAMACGTPVIAYGKGGVLDSVIDSSNSEGRMATGCFFEDQTVTSLIAAMPRFEAMTISPLACRQRAEEFSAARFAAQFLSTLK